MKLLRGTLDNERLQVQGSNDLLRGGNRSRGMIYVVIEDVDVDHSADDDEYDDDDVIIVAVVIVVVVVVVVVVVDYTRHMFLHISSIFIHLFPHISIGIVVRIRRTRVLEDGMAAISKIGHEIKDRIVIKCVL